MQFYYGKLLSLRILDEIESWKMHEVRHALLICDLIEHADVQTEFRNWEDSIRITHQHIKKFMDSVIRNDGQITPQLHQQTLDMVTFCWQESMAFKQCCQKIIDEHGTALDLHTTNIVMKHIIDESDQFITTAQKILSNDRD